MLTTGYEEEDDVDTSFPDDRPQSPLRNVHFLPLLDDTVTGSEDTDRPDEAIVDGSSVEKSVSIFLGIADD